MTKEVVSKEMTNEIATVSIKEMFGECGITIDDVVKSETFLPILKYSFPICGDGHPNTFTVGDKVLQKGWIVSLVAAKKASRFYDEDENTYYSCIENPMSEKGKEDKEAIEDIKKNGNEVQEGMRCLVFIITKEDGKIAATYAELGLYKSLYMYMWKNLNEGKAQDGKMIQVNIEDHSCNLKNNKILQASKFKQITRLPITKDVQCIMRDTLERQKELVMRWANY